MPLGSVKNPTSSTLQERWRMLFQKELKYFVEEFFTSKEFDVFDMKLSKRVVSEKFLLLVNRLEICLSRFLGPEHPHID